MRRCDTEVRNLMTALSHLSQYSGSEIFPNLKTIAVGSLYRKQSSMWTRYDKLHVTDPQDPVYLTNPGLCFDLFDHFLSTSNVESCCIRDFSGPLGMRPIAARPEPSFPSYRPQMTIHTNIEPDIMSVRLGQKTTRWISDVPPSEDWYSIYENLLRSFAELANIRNEHYLHSKDDIINLEIFRSTRQIGPSTADRSRDHHPSSYPRIDDIAAEVASGAEVPLSVVSQRAIVSKVSALCQATLRRESKVKDIFKWYSAADIPKCQWRSSSYCISMVGWWIVI